MPEIYLLLTKNLQFIVATTVAIIALVVSIISLIKSARAQRVATNLAQMQIDKMHEEKNKTNISVKHIQSNGKTYFVLENIGKSIAKDIHFEFFTDDENDHYVGDCYNIDNNYRKILIDILHPGEEQTIRVVFNGGAKRCEVAYSWENPDGIRDPEQKHFVTPEF